MNSRMAIWLERLGDANPETRREAINQLEVLGEPEALGPLAACFAHDVDPELRALARHAGKQIYYLLMRRANQPVTASQDQREQAADILARARSEKQKRGR